MVGGAVSPSDCRSPRGWPAACSSRDHAQLYGEKEGAPERIKFKSEFEESTKGLAKDTQ